MSNIPAALAKRTARKVVLLQQVTLKKETRKKTTNTKVSTTRAKKKGSTTTTTRKRKARDDDYDDIDDDDEYNEYDDDRNDLLEEDDNEEAEGNEDDYYYDDKLSDAGTCNSSTIVMNNSEPEENDDTKKKVKKESVRGGRTRKASRPVTKGTKNTSKTSRTKKSKNDESQGSDDDENNNDDYYDSSNDESSNSVDSEEAVKSGYRRTKSGKLIQTKKTISLIPINSNPLLKLPITKRIQKRLRIVTTRDAAKEVLRAQLTKGVPYTDEDYDKLMTIYHALGHTYTTMDAMKFEVSKLQKKSTKKQFEVTGLSPLTNRPSLDKDEIEGMFATSDEDNGDDEGDDNNNNNDAPNSGKRTATKKQSTTKKNKTSQAGAITNDGMPIDADIDAIRQPPPPIVDDAIEKPRNRGGRPKGSKNFERDENDNIVVDADGKPINKKYRSSGRSVHHPLRQNKLIFALTAEATQRYMDARDKARETDSIVQNGTLQNILIDVCKGTGVDPSVIRVSTIFSRARRNNPTGKCLQKTPLLDDMENDIAKYCVQLARIGQRLDKDQVTHLTRMFVQRIPGMEDKIIAMKKQRKLADCIAKDGTMKSDDELREQLFGTRWYFGFIRRHKETILQEAKCDLRMGIQFFHLKLSDFKAMYDLVYEQMVTAGIAETITKATLYDMEGNRIRTTNREVAYGLPTRYRVIKPNYLIYVDEVGSRTIESEQSDFYVGARIRHYNTQKHKKTATDNSGHIGGQMFSIEVQDSTYPQPDDPDADDADGMTEMSFSVYCFSDGNGDSILCLIVLKSDRTLQDIPLSVRWGIDTTKAVVRATDEMELYELNCGPGQAMHGGPTCVYNGKVIPCMVKVSPTGTMTSTILNDVLRFFDDINLCDRTATDGVTPFILLDGHNSNFEPNLLDYIANDATKWTICSGVHRDAHLLQVADPSEYIGAFKESLSQAKEHYLANRLQQQQQQLGYYVDPATIATYFYPSDIIPLVTHAWNDSFGNSNKLIGNNNNNNNNTSTSNKIGGLTQQKRCIALRGWNPMNYALFLHPALNKHEQLADVTAATTTAMTSNKKTKLYKYVKPTDTTTDGTGAGIIATPNQITTTTAPGRSNKKQLTIDDDDADNIPNHDQEDDENYF